jgi:3-deoxy-D-manno-octulosonate 8-phosphate phosphatase (KDO 8-P phosphatase)
VNNPDPITALIADASLRPMARRIRLVVLDVDGVMTDGGLYLGDADNARVELKRFDIQDGLGIKMLQKAGLRVAIITGRVSRSVALRAQELGVDDLVQDSHARKARSLNELCHRYNIAMDDVAFIGDDLPDIGPMRLVGLPVCVANATADARAAARCVLSRAGGHGAVREFCETLLRARGEWDALVAWYVASREESHE